MIIVGEKINGSIPRVRQAIAERDEAFIAQRALAQAQAGADYIDCCASVETSQEYGALSWLISVAEGAQDKPVAVDSPNERLIARILEEGLARREGIVNSVSGEGAKCETLFPLIAGTGWQAIGLACDERGIPSEVSKKVDIAKSIIDKADKYGVDISNIHIDPAVMALPASPSAMLDFEECIRQIKAYAPTVKITGAISNISFEMPYRRAVNQTAMVLAIRAGLDSAILDPLDRDLAAAVYAAEALSGRDKAGRKYNRAYRAGKFGPQKTK
jgi:5-methyltetrahydrofolate--homocysteine methyltransferase